VSGAGSLAVLVGAREDRTGPLHCGLRSADRIMSSGGALALPSLVE